MASFSENRCAKMTAVNCHHCHLSSLHCIFALPPHPDKLPQLTLPTDLVDPPNCPCLPSPATLLTISRYPAADYWKNVVGSEFLCFCESSDFMRVMAVLKKNVIKCSSVPSMRICLRAEM